jgi:hypothetical protein
MTTTIVPDKNDDTVSDVTMTISEALKSGKIEQLIPPFEYSVLLSETKTAFEVLLQWTWGYSCPCLRIARFLD